MLICLRCAKEMTKKKVGAIAELGNFVVRGDVYTCDCGIMVLGDCGVKMEKREEKDGRKIREVNK